MQVSQEVIAAAAKASVALTLEAARQMKDGVTIRRPGAVIGSLENLSALRECFSEGQKLAEKMLATDPEGYYEVTKGVAARAVGKSPEELEMGPDQVKMWLGENFNMAKSFVDRKYQALEAYLS